MLGTNKINKIHFIGVGGAGMSGIAEILLNLIFQVSLLVSTPQEFA